MLNQVQLIGHVGADPEKRHLTNGDPVCSFSLATTEKWTDKGSGERRERTEWHRITVYNHGLCDVVENYVAKGSRIFVQGQLRTRTYPDPDGGKDRHVTEIVLDHVGSVMKLLGDAKGGGDRRGETDKQRTVRQDQAELEGRNSRGNGRTNGANGNGGRRPFIPPPAHDLDDEIPF
jgi:single-strand DNA-binding protein